MELILISRDKLKIMLSETDMEKYHISGDELDYSIPNTRNVIKNILSDAKVLTGFDTDGQTYFVQLYTSIHGGCEMFITKEDKDEGDTQEPQSVKKYSALFSFESFHDMICACRRLRSMGADAGAVAYRDMKGRYFLCLRHSNLSPYARLDKYTFILEYGTRENFDSFELYIKEYGTWVCHDAVNCLGEL